MPVWLDGGGTSLPDACIPPPPLDLNYDGITTASVASHSPAEGSGVRRRQPGQLAS
jgi:hypothetical protein